MWWVSVNGCYLMLLKGGMQKQRDSNIAAVMGKEANSTIVTHGTIRVHYALTIFPRHIMFYRSGSIILVYDFLLGTTQDSNITMMHTTLTNVLQSSSGSITAAVELDEVEKVTSLFGLFRNPYIHILVCCN